MKLLRKFAFLTVAASLVLAACAPAATPEPTQAPAPTMAPTDAPQVGCVAVRLDRTNLTQWIFHDTHGDPDDDTKG